MCDRARQRWEMGIYCKNIYAIYYFRVRRRLAGIEPGPERLSRWSVGVAIRSPTEAVARTSLYMTNSMKIGTTLFKLH